MSSINKIKLPSGTTYDVNDVRISGVDTTPTSGSSNVVTSGGVYTGLSGKADKSATVSTVTYDTTNKKITKTINGTTTDVVTASTLVTDGGGVKNVKTVNNNSLVGTGNVSVGTVTSVSAGTGLSISGTASVNPTVNVASGYKLPTTTEWTNATPFEKGTGTNSAKQKGTGADACGTSSVAEGSDTIASGSWSHAEGQATIASGRGSHAEGVTYNNIDTSASADAAHAEGAGVVVKGQAAHGEGVLNVAGRTQEEAVAALADFPNLGGSTQEKVSKLIGFASHSEGSSTRALGTSSHAEGNSTQALVNATHAEGDTTTASGEAAHSEGYNTTASGNQSHSEGFNTQATANQAHSEGKKTIASAENAHSEGNETKAVGNASHSEGYRTYAYGAMSHIEGTSSTLVSDANAASEDVEDIWGENGHNFSLSRGQGSHVEGKNCLATGDWSHAEGVSSLAMGNGSHAEGSSTRAQNQSEHAEGKYNISISGSTIHTVGIGTSSTRKNAHTITTDGKHYIPGIGTYRGTETTLPTGQDLATIVNSKVTCQGSSENNHIALFDGATGTVIKDSGYTIATSVPSGAVFTDSKVTQSQTTANETYGVLLKNTTGNTNETNPVKYSSGLIFNPSTTRLGIGTTSPGYTLHVNGTAYSAASTVAETYVQAKNGNVYVGGSSGARCHQQYDSTNKCLKFIFD